MSSADGMLSASDKKKQAAAYKAVELFVKDGMTVGLGTGSTAYFAVERIGQLLHEGKLNNIRAIPTSEATKAQALSLNIPMISLDVMMGKIDVAIDGADEVELDTRNVLKGRGGALLREKQVAAWSKKFVCIIDESKIVSHLSGEGKSCPIEITKNSYRHIQEQIENLPSAQKNLDHTEMRLIKGASESTKGVTPNKEADLYVTDNGNYICDVFFKKETQTDLHKFTWELYNIVGVIEHGFFLDMKPSIVIGGDDAPQVYM